RDHADSCRERRHQLTPDPITRIIDPTATTRTGHHKPPDADHRQDHPRVPHLIQKVLHEIRPGRDRRAVQEHYLRTETPGQLRIQQRSVAVAVLTPIVDEHPSRHHYPPPGGVHPHPAPTQPPNGKLSQ